MRRKRRNWDWNVIIAHRKLCKRYSEAYAAKLAGGRQSVDYTTICLELEEQLDTLNIILIREQIELEVNYYV